MGYLKKHWVGVFLTVGATFMAMAAHGTYQESREENADFFKELTFDTSQQAHSMKPTP